MTPPTGIRERKWLLGLLLLALAACNGTTAAWKTYVDPTAEYLTFHFFYPPGWSIERRESELVLTSPEPKIEVHVSSRPAGEQTAEACAAARFAREGGDSRAIPAHFVSMNSDTIFLEDSSHVVACFETRTRLPYPLVTMAVTAPATAFSAHGEAIRGIFDSLRFRPTV